MRSAFGNERCGEKKINVAKHIFPIDVDVRKMEQWDN
jgi:hypothetical protein